MLITILKDAKDLQQLKKLYFSFAKEYHPDMEHGNLQMMQLLNNEYSFLKSILKNASETKEKEYENINSMSAFVLVVEELLRYPKITLEIVGSWVWISGEGTYSIKDEVLKEKLSCRFSGSNKKWYWFDGIKETNRCKGGYLKSAINKYGIQTINSKGSPSLS